MSILLKNVIFNGKKQDILIEGEKIKKIRERLDFRAKEKIDGKGEKAVLPGLVNCHTHSAMVLFRGYGDDLPLKDWLEKKIWPLEKKLTAEDVYWGTKLACLEMIKSGTTTFNEMYWFEEAQIEAVKEMGMRAVIGLVLLDFLPMGNKEHVEKLHKKLASQKPDSLSLSVSPHSIYTVSKENLIWAKNFAKRNNLLLHIHLSETEKEVENCLKKSGVRPVEYLERIEFLNKNTILAHSIWLSVQEIEILAKRKSSLVHCPCSNMKLASGVFPYLKLKQAGINIALGTDGAASNNNLDLFEEMKFASLLAKTKEKDPTLAPAFEIFEAASINGARALNLNTGEIKEGRLADLILIDLNQICLKPGHNLLSDLVYSGQGNCLSELICNGKILIRDKKIEGEERILKEATRRAKSLICK